MKHFGATMIAGLLFALVAFFCGFTDFLGDAGRHRSLFAGVSSETEVVKPGVSQDGLLNIARMESAPRVPTRTKFANHERTLRAFIASNAGGVPTLYIESVKPHAYYALSGGFTVSPIQSEAGFLWISSSRIAFYGRSLGGELLRLSADLELTKLSQEPAGISEEGEFTTPSAADVPL